ncbi:MAG: MFS transporter [Rhodospirillaceae bacterium]
MLREVYRANPYGWLVVGLSFFILAFIFSARSALGLYMPYWEQDLGWSRSFISTGAAVVLIVMAVSSPFGGNLLDRFGPRLVFAGGLMLIGVSVLATGAMHAPWQFIIVFCVMGGIGYGATSLPQVAATTAQLFDRYRGLATGVASAGATGGQLLVLPVLALVIAALGWRTSVAAFGVIMIAVAVVVWFVFGPAKARVAAPDDGGPSVDAAMGTKLRFLFRDRTFWLLGVGFWICGFTTTGVVEMHLIPYAATCGFTPTEGATAYGVMSAVNMGGIILAGFLADRMSRPMLLAGVYFVRGLTFILLMFIAGDSMLLFLFAVVFGASNYAAMPVVASMVASHIGVRIMGLTLGLLFGLHSVGGAAGAFMAGKLFDLLATYDWTWIAALVLAMLAGVLTLCIEERRAPAPMQPVPVPQPA